MYDPRFDLQVPGLLQTDMRREYLAERRATAEAELRVMQLRQLDKIFTPRESTRAKRFAARRAERRLARRIAREMKP